MTAGAFLPERRGCAGKPMGLTLTDSPPPATPSAGRHGGQHARTLEKRKNPHWFGGSYGESRFK